MKGNFLLLFNFLIQKDFLNTRSRQSKRASDNVRTNEILRCKSQKVQICGKIASEQAHAV